MIATSQHHLSSWIGPDAYFNWQESCQSRQTNASFDVILITHPRDEADLPRMFPWSQHLSIEDRISLTRHLKPALGEALETHSLRVGILFLPVYAREMIHPSTRAKSREILKDGLRLAHEVGARIVCLGGLTGSLSLYGRKLSGLASELGIKLTTGHCATAISVLETYFRSIRDLEIDVQGSRAVVLGVGSVGGAFARLLFQQPLCPKELVLVDKASRQEHLASLCQSLQAEAPNTVISYELTPKGGELPADSACYDSKFLITAVSTANVIDIEQVAPGTVLIDDSQPYCWEREQAWQRCQSRHDIVPCEAGLIDCQEIGYFSRFPFDFADQDDNGASSTAWSCMSEGLLLALEPDLPTTIGEPSIENIQRYYEAFKQYNFGTPQLQCAQNKLPIAELKATLDSLS